MIPHCGFSSGWPREPLPLSQILVGVTQGAWLHLAAAEAERLYPGPQSLIFDLYPAPAPFAPLLRSVVAAALDLQAGGGGVLGLPRERRGELRGGRAGSGGEGEGLSDHTGFSLFLGRGRGFAEPGRSAQELEKPRRDWDAQGL